jgi:hypothetical protein
VSQAKRMLRAIGGFLLASILAFWVSYKTGNLWAITVIQGTYFLLSIIWLEWARKR